MFKLSQRILNSPGLQKQFLKSIQPTISEQRSLVQQLSSVQLFSTAQPKAAPPKITIFDKIYEKVFSEKHFTAKESFKGNKRWLMILPAFFGHMCLGTPWAWSIMAQVLARLDGFVTSAASDWTLAQGAYPLSLIFAFQGLTAFFAGKFQMRVGPRLSMSTAGCLFGSGWIIGSLGVYYHCLPLLYGGFGVLGGMGIGTFYTPPIQALLKWFPDRKGIASGFCIAGFGFGALVFTPLAQYIMKSFMVMPTYLGKAADLEIISQQGRLFAKIGGALKEVVIANKEEIAKLPYKGLEEGAYLVGSGNTSAALAIGLCGALWGSIMITSGFTIKWPHPSYVAPVAKVTSNSKKALKPLIGNVNNVEVFKTPQFYKLAMLFYGMSGSGIALFSVAKPLMGEVFMNTLPSIVTPSFTSTYVMFLSIGNLIGRILWALFLDKYGGRLTFNIFTMASIPLYGSIPFLINWLIHSHSSIPLYLFLGSTFLFITMVGGTFALLPAYEAELYGAKFAGPIHNRVFLGLSVSSFTVPQILFQLRSRSESSAIHNLIKQVPKEKFMEKFQTPIENAEMLIKSKTITIPKLMELVPKSVQDPTPFIYNNFLYTMAGIIAVSAACSYTIGPVAAKHFEIEKQVPKPNVQAPKKPENPKAQTASKKK